MKQLLEEKFNIAHDGEIYVSEIIFLAMIAILVIVIVLLIVEFIKGPTNKKQKRKRELFSNKKCKRKERKKQKTNIEDRSATPLYAGFFSGKFKLPWIKDKVM